jgi:hypothetical protein
MSWREKLKNCQKAGITVGVIHFAIYMALLYQSSQIHEESGAGFMLFFMEAPWWGLFMLLGLWGAVTVRWMFFVGVIGTCLYAVAAMVMCWLFLTIRQRTL